MISSYEVYIAMVTRISVEEDVAEGAVVAEVPLAAAAAVARIKKESIKKKKIRPMMMRTMINSRPLQQR